MFRNVFFSVNMPIDIFFQIEINNFENEITDNVGTLLNSEFDDGEKELQRLWYWVFFLW